MYMYKGTQLIVNSESLSIRKENAQSSMQNVYI